MDFRVMFGAAVATLSVASAFAESSWTTGKYDPATWTANVNNLLKEATPTDEGLSFYNENGKTMAQNLAGGAETAMAALADGVVPGKDCDYNKIVGIATGCNMYWTLADAATLDSLTVYSRWGDGGRDGINLSYVQIKHPGDDDWTNIGSGVSFGNGDNNTGPALFATLANADRSPLATNVIAIRIRFSSSQDNGGSGYVEIEAAGSMASLPQVQLGVNSVESWTAVLSGTVTDLVGAESADLYFAYGTTASSLEPILVKSGLSEGETFEISLEGLNDSTVYHYSYYLKTNEDKSSTLKTGVFTTGYAQPVVLTVARGYFDRSSSEILYAVDNLGEQGTSVDLYFAYGTSETLTPTLYTSGLGLGSGVIPLTGLTPGTTYYYAIYAKNQLGHFCETATGSFLTNADDDTPKWVGRVSSDWSEPANWDPETTFTEGQSVTTVILSAFPGAHEPSNLDIAGLDIYEVRFGHGGKESFAVDGLPVRLRYFGKESGARSTLTFRNEVLFPSRECGGSFDDNTVRFEGVVHNSEDGIVTFQTTGNNLNSHAHFLNPANDVRMHLVAHTGGVWFSSDGALGALLDEDPLVPNVYKNHGTVYVECSPGKNHAPVVLNPKRYLKGAVRLAGNVDLTITGPIDTDLEIARMSGDVPNVVRFAGVSVSASQDFGALINFPGGTIGILDSESLAADRTRGIRCASSSFDLNGHDFAGMLHSYGWGCDNGAPIFNNNDRSREVTLTGGVEPYPHIGTEDTFFGGAGDIRVEVPVWMEEASGRSPQGLRKKGQGMLTLAGTQGSWVSLSQFHGGITLDYSVNNTPKLPEGVTGASVGYGKVMLVGNAEATTSELSSLSLDGGLTEFVTQPGAGGLTVALTSINYSNRERAIDFQLGAGTALTVADSANMDNFPGVWPNATWNRGETWVAANDDHTLGPVPDSALDTTLAAEQTVWNITSDCEVPGATPRGVRVVAPAGGATITLKGTVDIRKRNPGGVAGLLISSKSTGDVIFTGGAIKVENYNGELSIHNWNTNGVVRLGSQLPETNDNNLSVYGPGTTVFENDGNSFYYGPNAYGGGTVKFTSIADKGEPSALGKGNNGVINCGHGTTYEYIGTTAEGHASNREFALFGDVTLKANGTGPLRLTKDTAIGTGYRFVSSRLILAGDADKAGGELQGGVNVGIMGSVVKRGSGTWTIAAANSAYCYPTEVEEGTLILAGTLPSDVIVKSGATLVLKPGALIKRSLTIEKGATLVYDNISDREQEPASVWGMAKIDGNVRLAKRPKIGVSYRLISAEYGCEIGELDVPGMKVICDGQNIILQKHRGFSVIVK